MFGFALLLTGCGTSLENVQNDKRGIIFNGGSVAQVGDYLFFANGFAKDHTSFKDMGDYNKAKEYSKVNRTNNLTDATNFASSKNIETVSGNDVSGFNETYMFAYGDYLYYTAPTTHKTNENKFAFDHLSVFKVKFNGTGRSEIFYTANAYDATNGKIVALEYKGAAFLMIYDGKDFAGLNLTNGGTQFNIKDVTSVAFPQSDANWNGSIYYTKDTDTSNEGNEVFKIDALEAKEQEVVANGTIFNTVKFGERIDDRIFFTYSNNPGDVTKTYLVGANEIGTGTFTNALTPFYYGEIKDLKKVIVEESLSRFGGFVFRANDVIMYHNDFENTTAKLIDNSVYANAKVVAAVGEYAYFATSTGVFKISLLTKEVTTLVSDMTITTENFGYTLVENEEGNIIFDNLYFYAQRKYDAETKEEDKKDKNVYLYQISAQGGDVKLVSQIVE